MTQIESERIEQNNHGEIPKGGFLSFEARARNPSESLSLTKEVIAVISKYNEHNWPSDEYWEKSLPTWFIRKIKEYSVQKIIESNGRLWDYGSWLDAMKYRGWLWYSSELKPLELKIILEPYTYPFSVNPFEYLLLESGVNEGEIRYKDCTL